MRLVAFGVLAMLGACTEYQTAAVALHSAATTDTQNVNDDALAVEIQGLCAQPYSSLVRNSGKMPQLPRGILALCGPIPAPGTVAVFGGTVTGVTGTPVAGQ